MQQQCNYIEMQNQNASFSTTFKLHSVQFNTVPTNQMENCFFYN